jgi:hypothetical protein
MCTNPLRGARKQEPGRTVCGGVSPFALLARLAGDQPGEEDSVAGIANIQNSSAVTGNTAFVSGGGIYNSTGLVNLSSSLVSGNTPDNCVGVVGC